MSALVRVGLNTPHRETLFENGYKNQKEQQIVDEAALTISEFVGAGVIMMKIINSDMFSEEWILKPDAVIKLSTIEMIVKNSQGYIYNIELFHLPQGHFKLRLFFHKENVQQKYYKIYLPPSAVVKPVEVERNDMLQVDNADIENIKELIESVYNMKTIMPHIHMMISNDVSVQQYIVSFVGLESIDHAFIIYVAQRLGLTFLERVDIYKNSQVINNDILPSLNVDFYVRKCAKEASFKFVPLNTIDDTDSNRCFVSKRTVRSLGETTSDSETEHIVKKRVVADT